MTVLSLRLPDKLLKEADAIARKKKISRAAYIRETLEKANLEVQVENRKKRMKEASHKVRAESMKVNAEFAEIEKDAGD